MLELKRAKAEISQEDIKKQQLEFRISVLKDLLMEKLDQARALENEIKVLEAKRQALLEIGELANKELAKLLEIWSQEGVKAEGHPVSA
ncbi:hypothetical protein MGLY_10210 [Neomoorella glycerini]|uniref:Uncharacterized protein n=1 Tax=Neomoorella glycerini TaxID=55779 RepID=A0A6I5ZQ13_9FIRM|nr:hypothetical protein [Moorella glycerini]QGP91679.1 hypothetical protein MGLY_10210 [Moorella glycerini]